MKPLVFIPELIAPCGLELLRAACDCVAPWEDGNPTPEASQLRALLYEADAVIVRLFSITAQDLQKAGRLKVIAKHGVGVDNIDCQAATARRIPVVYTPEANTDAVAEYTLALMLALSRQINPASEALREGQFSERDRFQGVELTGKVLGIVGLGRISTRVAQIAALGFGMTVYAYDPYVSPATYSGPATLVEELETLLRLADFLSLHVPLTPETTRMIDAQRLARVKPGCRIINTSRGGVIDEDALILALREGRLAGAALDVFEEEPLPADHSLCHAPNVLLTPHIAGLTQTSLERTALMAAQGILDVLQGRTPEHVVNPEALG